MIRTPIIGGNWKMNRGTPKDAREMLKELIPLISEIKNVDIVITPPYTALITAIEVVQGTNIKIGAQNMYYEEKGAFTGEISPNYLIDIGCEYVILGHSERRDIFNETDELINKKLKKALSMNLIPIVCIGEHLTEREAGKTTEIVRDQINQTFKDLDKESMKKIIIAYEPVWAIGTGRTATPEQAEEVHNFIHNMLNEKYDRETADEIRIQYGGSIKPENAEDLFKQKNIDGGLVGGASLQADSLYHIIQAAERSYNLKLI